MTDNKVRPDSVDGNINLDNPFVIINQIHHAKKEIEDLETWDLAKHFYHGVRCGDTILVQAALSLRPTLLNELDTNLLGALHYVVRYNQVKILRLLLSLGANVNIRGHGGLRPLHIAASENNAECLGILLNARRIKIDSADEKGQTALHIATKRSNADIVNTLLEHRANIMQKENDGVNVLHGPARKDDKYVCNILLNKPALIWAPDNNGLNPLMEASSEGGLEVLQTFINIIRIKNENLTQIINHRDNDGNTSLHFASLHGHTEVIKLLIECKAEVNATRNDKSTPLHGAALMGSTDAVQVLIDNGASIQAADIRRRTALHKAVITNQNEVVDILIKNGANANAQDDDFKTPLHWAARKGNVYVTKCLLNCNPSLKTRDINMRTALHWAVIGESVELIKLILDHPDVATEDLINLTDIASKTPLHIAVENGNAELVKLLLSRKASTASVDDQDRNAAQIASKLGHLECLKCLMDTPENKKEALIHRDGGEYTSLLLAAESGEKEVFQFLCNHSANFNAKDEHGKTALMMSVTNGQLEIAKTLLEKDVDVNALDKNKNTALHYACKGDFNGACIKLLLEYGAQMSENFSHETPVDVALLLKNEAAIEILFDDEHYDWVMSFRRHDGKTVLDALIKHSPETVKLILNRCMQETSEDPLDKNFSILYSFRYIDPGPDDPASSSSRYFALRTMAEERQEELIEHPICSSLLKHKWVNCVRYIFSLDLIMYLIFLGCLTSFVVTQNPPKPSEIDATTGCKNQTTSGGSYSTKRATLTDPTLLMQKAIITAFLTLQCLNHLFKMIYTKKEYFLNAENYFFLILYGFAWAFVYPPDSEPCKTNWVCGMVASVLAWGLLIFEIEHLPITGLYALMFQKVLISLVKVILVFCFFIMGFATSFYIAMRKETPFQSMPYALMKTFDMTVGELEFVTYFIDTNYGDFQEALYAIFLIFVVMMNIALMNLLIGVAVGDIDGIRKDASMSLLKIRINLIYGVETNLPAFLQRRLHKHHMEIFPNKQLGLCSSLLSEDYGQKYKRWLMSEHDEDDTSVRLKSIEDKISENKEGITQLIKKLK